MKCASPQQQEEEEHFPCLDPSAAPQKKRAKDQSPLGYRQSRVVPPSIFARRSRFLAHENKKGHWRITFVGKRSLEWPCERGSSPPLLWMNYLSLAFPTTSAECDFCTAEVSYKIERARFQKHAKVMDGLSFLKKFQGPKITITRSCICFHIWPARKKRRKMHWLDLSTVLW